MRLYRVLIILVSVAMAGFLSSAPAKADILTAIAQCESSGNAHAVNGSHVGLLQISTRLHGGDAARMGLNLWNPQHNMAFGRYLLRRDGLAPWAQSRHCWGSKTQYASAQPQRIYRYVQRQRPVAYQYAQAAQPSARRYTSAYGQYEAYAGYTYAQPYTGGTYYNRGQAYAGLNSMRSGTDYTSTGSLGTSATDADAEYFIVEYDAADQNAPSREVVYYTDESNEPEAAQSYVYYESLE